MKSEAEVRVANELTRLAEVGTQLYALENRGRELLSQVADRLQEKVTEMHLESLFQFDGRSPELNWQVLGVNFRVAVETERVKETLRGKEFAGYRGCLRGYRVDTDSNGRAVFVRIADGVMFQNGTVLKGNDPEWFPYGFLAAMLQSITGPTSKPGCKLVLEPTGWKLAQKRSGQGGAAKEK